MQIGKRKDSDFIKLAKIVFDYFYVASPSPIRKIYIPPSPPKAANIPGLLHIPISRVKEAKPLDYK